MTVFVADQVSDINKRLRELALETEMRDNLEKATGLWLDMHGQRAGLERNKDETDFYFRNRIRAKLVLPNG